MNSFHRKLLKISVGVFATILIHIPLAYPIEAQAHFSSHHEKKETTVTKPFGISGTSENIVLNDIHCGFLPEGCSVSFGGKAKVSTGEQAEYTAHATIDWQHAYPNGRGGYCAAVKAEGTMTVGTYKKSYDANTIFFTVHGTTCDESVSNELGVHLYDGTVYITGGNGIYKNAKGTAVLQAKDNLQARNGFFEARGEITMATKASQQFHHKYTYQEHTTKKKSKK